MGNIVLNLWACRAALWERVLGLILRKCTSGKLLSTRLLSLKNDGNSASLGVCGSRGFALGLGVLGTRLREAWGPASSGRFVCGVREWDVLGICRRVCPPRSPCVLAASAPACCRGAGGAASPGGRRYPLRAPSAQPAGGGKGIHLYNVFHEHEATNSSLWNYSEIRCHLQSFLSSACDNQCVSCCYKTLCFLWYFI